MCKARDQILGCRESESIRPKESAKMVNFSKLLNDRDVFQMFLLSTAETTFVQTPTDFEDFNSSFSVATLLRYPPLLCDPRLVRPTYPERCLL